MQSHKEARLWNDVFVEAQDLLNIPRGTIKVNWQDQQTLQYSLSSSLAQHGHISLAHGYAQQLVCTGICASRDTSVLAMTCIMHMLTQNHTGPPPFCAKPVLY